MRAIGILVDVLVIVANVALIVAILRGRGK